MRLTASLRKMTIRDMENYPKYKKIIQQIKYDIINQSNYELSDMPRGTDVTNKTLDKTVKIRSHDDIRPYEFLTEQIERALIEHTLYTSIFKEHFIFRKSIEETAEIIRRSVHHTKKLKNALILECAKQLGRVNL
jgi:hypothetical protein